MKSFLLYNSIGLLLITSSAIQLTQANEKLAFVYEMVRHGARAPIVEEPAGAFHVGIGLLTETGMR